MKICVFTWYVMYSPNIDDVPFSTETLTEFRYSSFVLAILSCVLGLVGNTVVIFFAGFVMKKHKSRIWFLNLAIADYLFLLILPFNAVSVLKEDWFYGEHVCQMYNFLSIANMYGSIFLITAMTFERFLSVMAPIWHHRFYSPRVSCCTCVAVWVVTALSSIPAILYSQLDGDDRNEVCGLYYSDINTLSQIRASIYGLGYLTVEEWIVPASEACEMSFNHTFLKKFSIAQWNGFFTSTHSYLVPVIVIGYLIPLCVIICCNIAIVCKVRTSGTIRSSKLYRLVTAAVMTFFITRTPLVIAQSIILSCFQSKDYILMRKTIAIYPLLSSIAYLNCCLNPIIYVFLGREVMSEFRNLHQRIRQIKATSSCSLQVLHLSHSSSDVVKCLTEVL
uniref:G-protein coupled receptors family 1 profile domain-containing protein n=1 Tax=Leptobrachium leishanense TaxID=445787 RepID=A0A8C5PHT8_9ANUR